MGVLTRSRTAKVLGGIAVIGASALVLAGCAGDSEPAASGDAGGNTSADFPIDCEAAEPASYTPEYTSTSTGPGTDLTYTIGTALPVTGNLAFLGPPEISATEFAASEINAAGKGITIDLKQGDSGDTDNKAYETEIPRLLGEGATAIIGAASSGTSLQFIDQVIAANAIQFSPANTSAAFTGYKDNGLYWRTAPSDVLQGEVLGNLIGADGNETLGMIVLNDAYGTGLACFTKAAFEAAGGEVVATSLYNTGDTNFSAQVEDVLAAGPDAIALITFEEVKTIIPELIGADVSPEQLYLVDGNLANFGDDFEAGTMAGAKGTYPAVDPASIATFRDNLQAFWTGAGNAELQDFTYGPESYDAVVLLALAALQAGSTAGPDVAANLQAVSGGSGDGTKCTSFAECADLIIAGQAADYDGVSGPITFNEVGDPTEASIGVFEYGDDNNYEFVRVG
ncbi:amino acid ABC transporter substrate-binding protein [Microbacterium sp. AISO3]|uniref:Branched-chain amino acid transport system substrate-binding protein n=2 Tax=Microbacterium TaxID=33882 RepID=A0ABU1I0E0_9MICO|nr:MULTISPECIES: ABC transporter substrate-binding protein [Microbacterium]APF35171.1 amino acid ABC transporter substrate-binding protein [Microbacterium paludicola]MDR6167354.1 branched-chain amino acid transport system substrate-binding protein [Microbacterium paludicola]OAZ44178.1 amino acid ABC transporter substrate-binding protein [Microbacterium arborescens]OWP20771.1 amino acid ABC transporter substrate-binding protein [Microbacterium sp. AISO3]POX65667.1 amino acid ABC transporter sub